MFSIRSTNRLRSTSLVRLMAVFAIWFVSGIFQLSFAQQGSECLACHTGLPATMANVIPEESGNEAPVSNACDYSSADLFNGWGWNPITRQSCPPLPAAVDPVASTCDYSNASLYNGWGWDPVARASCPPVEEEDPHANFPICSATLFDADGDGFGWENEASCIVTSASALPPVFTNSETGNQVDLVRAYWDGNTDLADKVLRQRFECHTNRLWCCSQLDNR